MTLRQVAAVREHTAPVAVLAPVAGASVRVVDVGAGHRAAEPGPAERYRVRRGSGRIDRVDALTAAETERAFEVGRTLADEEVDAGADLLVPAALGVGASTPASVLVAALTGAEPVATIGRGSGIDDARLDAQGGRRPGRAAPGQPAPAATRWRCSGWPAAPTSPRWPGSACRPRPGAPRCCWTGWSSAAAALVADELDGGARAWWLLAQRSPEPAMAHGRRSTWT